MRFAFHQHARLGIAAGLLAAASGVAVVTATAHPATRAGLLAQLERPAKAAVAAPKVTAAHGRAVIALPSGRIVVRMSPNRAAERNALSVAVTRRDRPIDVTGISVSYSMPAMNMWHVLTTHLAPAGSGRYAASEPVLGMAGTWRLDITARLPSGATIVVAVEDRMPV